MYLDINIRRRRQVGFCNQRNNKMKKSLYIVMPAYNEKENIEQVIKSWYPLIEGKDRADTSRLVVADSGSSDGTHEILTNLQRDYPKLQILMDIEKQHGPKVIALYQYAIDQGADYIFQTDSDGQTNPKEFEDFWKLTEHYDLIIGNRTARGDGKSRAYVEKVVCLLLWVYFGVKVPDANAPFRLMKSSVVKKYIDRMPYDYNIPNIMFTTYFKYYNEKMLFKEITFKPRQGGKNSINIPRIIKIGWKALGDFRSFKREMKLYGK